MEVAAIIGGCGAICITIAIGIFKAGLWHGQVVLQLKSLRSDMARHDDAIALIHRRIDGLKKGE